MCSIPKDENHVIAGVESGNLGYSDVIVVKTVYCKQTHLFLRMNLFLLIMSILFSENIFPKMYE